MDQKSCINIDAHRGFPCITSRGDSRTMLDIIDFANGFYSLYCSRRHGRDYNDISSN